MKRLTVGEYCSNMFAHVFASWRFVIPFLTIVGGWAFLNGIGELTVDKDLAFVNFTISFITLFIDLVIVMNQIRQTNTDREKLAAILSLERNIMTEISKVHTRLNKILVKYDTVDK